MADNMIELVAGLNISDSADQINKVDIPNLEKKLNAINLKCSIGKDSIASLQSDISKVTQNQGVKIDVQTSLDSKVINKDVNAVKKAFQLGLKGSSITEFRNELKPLLQEFKDAYTSLDSTAVEASLKKIISRFSELANKTIVLDDEAKKLKADLKEALTYEGKISIDSPTYGDLVSSMGSEKAANNVLNTVFGKKNWAQSDVSNRLSHQGFDTVAEQFKIDYNELADGILRLYDVMSQDLPKGTFLDTLEDDEKILNELASNLKLPTGVYEQFGNELVVATENAYKLGDAVDQVASEVPSDTKAVSSSVDEISAALSAFNVEIQKTGSNKDYPLIPNIGTTKEVLENAKAILNESFSGGDNGVEDRANRIKRAVEDTSGKLQRFYVQVEKGDKSVETLTYALNEQGNAYEYLGKTIREADNSTDFRRKDIGTQWDIQTQKLQQFIANVEKAGAASTVLNDDIANLKSKLNDKGDTSAMNSFLDDFDIAKAKFQAFNAEVRKDKAMDALRNRIRNLSADIDKYAAANKRAIESTQKMSSGKTFAEEWSRITSEMTKGANLTAQEVTNLSADLRVFGKEAEAAGLKGESAFGKFLNSFKTMSSYITANMVFNAVKRQLRQMIEEVKAVDTAMVELRKVTSATEYEFQEFAKSATKTGIELGASVSDVINATATFARLGESLPDAEELGRVATLYKNVGDGIDIETASEDIISTMKAFKIEAKDAIKLVDKFNEVESCPFYILIERNRRQIFPNCWEILKSFSLLFSKRRKPETSKRIAYGEKKRIQSAKVVCVLSVV